MSRASVTAVASSASSSILLHQDALWQMNMRSREQTDSGPYPVREGEPDCSYYIRTGLCRFGTTCRFNHPPNRKLAIATARVKGEYPERIGQPECQYYLKTGTCKFGVTCKFHHPRDKAGSAGRVALNVLGYPLRPGQMGSVLSSESKHPTTGNSQNDGTSHQGEPGNVGSQFHSRSVPMGYYAFQGDNVFPERPGQPECQFYMKTGDCKFGAVCKFHHPRERLIPVPDCVLSPIGLPLRPGEPLCVFYSRYGICKFGPSCKFDHPMRVFAYNAAASSSTDSPAVRRFLTSSPGTVALSFSADGLVETGSTNNRRLSLSEARQKSLGDNNIDSE
ncbi:hypothetical protein DH2020_021815 [Rehmannia glutinosa]|uniref:C3H1-type domain-containing protein n=1 Tax=Rehmannia glutinosa TaxID=99300 RepID=A0ABR0VUP8_REHGL